MKTKKELEAIANQIRLDIVRMTYQSGLKGAHLGGCLSIADILAVLYGSILNYNINIPEWDSRDRLILSKAHAAMGLYSALKYAGFLLQEDIYGAMRGNSDFFEHPKQSLKHGIEFSGGSLGQGLSLGMGTALALKKKDNTTSKIYVILGDGECDEGQVWEAAFAISHFQLNNITIIVDANRLQYDGKNEDIMKQSDMMLQWMSIGFEVVELNGHDVLSLQDFFLREHDKPRVVVANTVKGKGISFAENVVEWHTGRLTDDLYKKALEDLSE